MAETNKYIDQHQEEFIKAIEHLKKELTGLRTGRAQATIVENLPIQVYGATTPLMQLASISVPDAKSISVEVWDKSIMKDVEKSLSQSDLGLSVVNTGDKLIASVPAMTEENRRDLIKIMGEKVEATKIGIRQIRDKIKESILKAEKDKELTEDDKYKFLADLDNFTTDYNKQIEEVSTKKEKEIMTV